MLVDEYFNDIEKKYNGKLTLSTSTWFNGHSNLPFLRYKLQIGLNTCDIIIYYEYRSNEFTNSSTIDGGAFKDRHIVNINCYLQENNIPLFEVKERNLFNKVFNKSSITKFIIKCDNIPFKKRCYQSVNLLKLYEIVENSPELRPLINSIKKEQKHIVEIKYNTNKFNKNVIECLICFCEEISVWK